MKLYTKTGDDGTTGLFGGLRVSKSDARVAAYGTLDEVNAALGLARAVGLSPSTDAVIHAVQVDLFTLGAELACAPGKEEKLGMTLVGETEIRAQEQAIDAATAEVEPLRTFILPGGSPSGAALHVARTVARRAERELVALRATTALRDDVLRYVNRLSDLLFALARLENHRSGAPEVPWVARGSRV